MDIQQLESELKKLSIMPAWGKKQSDDWDKLSNFVYQLPTYEEFLNQLKLLNKSTEFNNYAIHRWFNTLSAVGVEKLFCKNNSVQPNKNKYDKLIDFSINGIHFDHKTTVFPKNYSHDFSFAKENPLDLIQWLYREQSKQGRYHTGNRLFLVLYNSNGNHWELRKKLSFLDAKIYDYVNNFDVSKLYQLELEKGKITYSDILWVMN
jgi:hypothetical protein